MGIFLVFVLLLGVLIIFFVVSQEKFGKLPKGNRLVRIHLSPNYKAGSFQNLSPTPDLTEGATYFSVMKEFLFAKKIRMKPSKALPSVKTNLLDLAPDENVLVWFGHSSYFIQLDGKTFLVDPVFSGFASPFSFSVPSFSGTDVYKVSDLPAIDYLLISHDHWDHLDYETLLELKSKVATVICGLGIGAHFEAWGFDTTKLIEEDWNSKISLSDGFTIFTTPARHFSGRGLKRNQALWTSFVLQTPSRNIYIGGDSGYDTHFKEIGIRFGPFDLAVLENGQYDKSWKYIHMQPEEVVQAAIDLSARHLVPVHSAKFSLGNHSWDEPLKRISALPLPESLILLTPRIGEKLILTDTIPVFPSWWDGIE